jgi:hypothetical protein
MRLHSDFHDYYDHAIGYGVDERVHYNRYQKPASINLKSHLNRPSHRNSGLMGFCGKTYPFIELHRYDRNFAEEDNWGEYSIVETRFAFSEQEYLDTEKERSDFRDEFHSYLYSIDLEIRQYFNEWILNSDETFLEHRVPVWSAKFYTEEPNAILNPRLKDYAFEKLREPFTAFQDISMYLANIRVEQKHVDFVDDKHRIEQHGFDLKRSFRHRNQENK